jgi:predicted NUDIX family NTP pyrophosphohydrolase
VQESGGYLERSSATSHGNARPRQSAGLLMFRLRDGEPEVLLVHPGGPFWAKKDEGAWSIPKGEYPAEEEPLAAARREFAEETGCRAQGPFIPLTPVTQRSGKVVHAWAVEGDCDPAQLRSNVFSLEWPPKSGKRQEFPEVDRAEWFSVPVALRKINPAQRALLTELATLRGSSG